MSVTVVIKKWTIGLKWMSDGTWYGIAFGYSPPHAGILGQGRHGGTWWFGGKSIGGKFSVAAA